MTAVLVTVTRYFETFTHALTPDYPGWVECVLTDAAGVEHVFVEKVPIVTAEDLDASSDYPRPATLACEIVEQHILQEGRERVTIDTERPWGIESTKELSRFVVFAEQLVE